MGPGGYRSDREPDFIIGCDSDLNQELIDTIGLHNELYGGSFILISPTNETTPHPQFIIIDEAINWPESLSQNIADSVDSVDPKNTAWAIAKRKSDARIGWKGKRGYVGKPWER